MTDRMITLRQMLEIIRSLLTNPQGMTVHQLEELTGLSLRTIYRYLSAIDAAGIPLEKRESAGTEIFYWISGPKFLEYFGWHQK